MGPARTIAGKTHHCLGNTGNSSAPHLHFDRRTYWNSPSDLGPTMPTFFGDKTHSAWRPVTGELLLATNS